MRRAHLLPLAATLALLATCPARAERVAVRAGDHPDRSRVVFDWPAKVGYRIEEGGPDRVVLRFARAAEFDLPRRLPRNVLAVTREEGAVVLALRPGARLQDGQLQGRVILDVMDPPARPPAEATRPERRGTAERPAQAEGAAPPRPAGQAPLPAPAAAPPTGPAARPDASAVPAPQPRPAAVTPPPSLPPAGAVAVRIATAPGRGRALALALPEGTGLAVLRRGDALLAVLDAPVPLELGALRNDPLFGGAEALHLPEATVLRLPLAAPAVLAARREGASWLLEPAREASPGRSILPDADGRALALRAARPGRVVALDDPETGLPLLVGTVAEPEQSSPLARRLPRAELLPTLLGTALLARGDGVSLRPGAERFVLEGAGAGPLVLAGPSPAAASMTRLFDLPSGDPAAVQERLRAQQASIAVAAPLQRPVLRRDAAETLLALGLPQEAQAMLRLAFQEDPRAGADLRTRGLHAAAALLAGRLPEAAALEEAAFNRTDEGALWRALLRAARGERAGAAPALAAAAPLLLGYPDAMRQRLLPLAAEALAEGGETQAAARLIQAAGPLPGMDYARGRLAEAEGKPPEALLAYEAAAQGRDRLGRARALRRSVELRLAAGALDAAGAAAALEATLFAWRGDAEEVEARLRLAALRRQAGDGRGSLALLKETAAQFPERAEALRPAMQDSLRTALEREPPLAAVALAESHPDLLPAGEAGSSAVLLLADRLVTLDLPDRAAAVLQRALAGVSGAERAALGARLAALRLQEGDAAAAATALAESEAPGLPAPLAGSRAILAARIQAGRGEFAAAVEALRALGPAGMPALAEMMAERQDWAGASGVLAALAAQPGGMDDARRRTVLRAAAYAALAGDAAQLSALRGVWTARMGEGPLAEGFAALTADPVRGVVDLPRLQRELNLFRGIPTRLEALRADASLAR